MIKTRFAPSPTGFLHIGGARTALFNWLYAKHCAGKFFLRIEDTDRQRSTQEAIQAIIKGMEWLELCWDGEVIYQSARINRHREVAFNLLDSGHAYQCYASPEEIAEFKRDNPYSRFVSPWRDSKEPGRTGVSPTIRLKTPLEGVSEVDDTVQGHVRVGNEQLDDMILLRSDGTPTYMLAVVVDDHDMGINTIIRGDDHFTNTFRQNQIYQALGWSMPQYAHIPLIHGADGKKLSKRHGAMGVGEYQSMGYLPEAIANYLLRLGWSLGDTEIIPMQKAIDAFSLDGLGKSPSRFDFDKLNYINSYYMRNTPIEKLFSLVQNKLPNISKEGQSKIKKGLPLLLERAQTINILAESSLIFIKKQDPIAPAARALINEMDKELFYAIQNSLYELESWAHEDIALCCKTIAKDLGVKVPVVMKTLRSLITGTLEGPGITEIMEVLGKKETLNRIKDCG